MTTQDYSQYPRRWQDRFDFFDAFGAPGTSTYNEGLAQRGREKKSKVLINFNFYAFFFGIIYFLILGLWRKALVLFAITFVIAAIPNIFNTSIVALIFSAALNMALIIVTGHIANYSYYLKEVKGSNSWNLFEGMQNK